jgi:hypothetical protein
MPLTQAIFLVNPDPQDRSCSSNLPRPKRDIWKDTEALLLSTDPQTWYAAIANEVSQSLLILERGQSGFIGAVRGNLSLGPLEHYSKSRPDGSSGSKWLLLAVAMTTGKLLSFLAFLALLTQMFTQWKAASRGL